MLTRKHLSFAAVSSIGGEVMSNNKGKLEGTRWANQAAKINGAELAKGIMTLEFTKDGKLRWEIGPMVLTGAYVLGPGDEVTFNMDEEISGGKTHLEKIAIKGDVLTLSDPTGTIVFDRLLAKKDDKTGDKKRDDEKSDKK